MDTMTTVADSAAARDVVPRAPLTLKQAGLGFDLMVQLVLKLLHLSGELTGAEVATKVGLPFSAIEGVLEFLCHEHQCAIVGGTLGPPSYRHRITDSGRTRANLFLETNQYVGVAPVPIGDYQRYMLEFKRSMPDGATPEQVRRAFSHLVLSDRILDKLGTAINALHSMFVYGPPGNGKSVIAEAVRNLLEGDIAIPHAVAVGVTSSGSSIRSCTTPSRKATTRRRSMRPSCPTAAGCDADVRWSWSGES